MQQIKNSKSQFITGYQSEINQVKSQFEQYLTSILENFTNKRNEINKSKEELIKVSNRNKQIESSIKELEGEYVDFIEIINGEETLHKL